MNNEKLVCNFCNKDFKVKKIKIKIEEVKEGLTRSYFQCPHCKHKYIIQYFDKEIEQNIKIAQELQEQKNKILNDKRYKTGTEKKYKINKIDLQIQNLQYKNLLKSNEYKLKY